MGTTSCKTSNCGEKPHQNNCIKGLAFCNDCALLQDKSVAINIFNTSSNCNNCNGYGTKMEWKKCGHCSSHCNRSNRESVDLIDVQSTMKLLLSAFKQNNKTIEELKDAVQFQYKNVGDRNGLLYYIGTKARTEKYMNPCDRKLVECFSSALVTDSKDIKNFVGRNSLRLACKPEDGNYMRLDLKNGIKIKVTGYSLRHYSSYDTEALRNWDFKARNVGEKWTVLLSHKNDCSLKKKGQIVYFSVDNSKYYSQFRIEQTGLNSNEHKYLACCGIELYGTCPKDPYGQQQTVLDEKEFEATSQEIKNLSRQIDANNSDYKARKKLYKEAKKIYKQQNCPVFINKNIKQKINQNKQKYKKANALPFTLTMDRDFKSFDRNKFKREFSSKLGIPINSIKIISVTEGSTIVHTNLHAFEKNGTKYTVGAICEKFLCTEEAAKRLVEFEVFLAEFGEPIDAFEPLDQKIWMNPTWNRTYGPGDIEWEGTLNNDKTEPYYCPVGWKKYTCKVTETSEDFDAKYKTWPVAYHGTKFSASMMISFSRLRAGGQPDVKNTSGADCFGTGVYFSPSIEYAAHPLYASPKKMSSNAKEHAGKWVQIVLNCRIKPGSWSVHSATVGDTSQQIDPNYENDKIEWLIHAPQGTYLDVSKVVFCGYMFRVTDNDPRQLPSSKWWNLDYYKNTYGIDVENKWYEK